MYLTKNEYRFRFLHVNHFTGHTAIYGDIFTVDKVIFLIAEKKTHAGNIFRLSNPKRWMLPMIGFGERVIMVIFYPARRNGINGNVIFTQRNRQGMSK